MTPFLKQVADFFHKRGDVGNLCFIFPNLRSEVFFKKYLCEDVAADGRPVLSPEMCTVNEFFFKLAGKSPADKVHLLLSLYECYARLNPKAEPLDDFIFWGDVIISDFDDTDKYLADPRHIFTNVADYKDMQGNFEFLTDAQREALTAFLSHFNTGGNVKQEFLRLWDIMLPLYEDFRRSLEEKGGLSREGTVYREVAESGESITEVLSAKFPHTGTFVFVGLNALSEAEKTVMRKMRNAGVAEFCWDYCGDWIKDASNKSSVFLSQFTIEFPQAFQPEGNEGAETEFRVISVPSTVGEAKLLPGLLAEIPDPGLETAVVLPEENLLLPVLNSIPSDITKLNVTMGYPMQGSALWTLMSDIAALLQNAREKDGARLFYHKQVWSIFANGIVKSLSDEQTLEIIRKVRNESRYYVPEEELRGSALLDLIFGIPSSTDIAAIGNALRNTVSRLAVLIKDKPEMALETDIAKEYCLAVGRLLNYDLKIKPATYFRLLEKLLGGASVPFTGEPLGGLQIMGPLETRALDFKNIIILGCNEGVFPRRSVSSSFIPPELRKGFGLPTYEYQDAVWAYYFYRLIHRAEKVIMIYDSRTEGIRGGEESRYIKQLEMHFKANLKRYAMSCPLEMGSASEEAVAKTQEDVDVLRETNLSASSINDYRACPARFYYSKVKQLDARDEINENMDYGKIGTVFHKAMELIYSASGNIGPEYLGGILADRNAIRDIVHGAILREMKLQEVTGRNIIFEDMVCRYVEQAVRRDIELLQKNGSAAFRIEGLEKFVSKKIAGFRFVGYIDRLDSLNPGELRIVDYKTGQTDGAAKSKIEMQLYLYGLFVKDLGISRGRKLFNSIYQTSRLFVEEIRNEELTDDFCERMEKELSAILTEIADISVPWKRNTAECEWCDFKNICGR